uniref:7TM_GPCR_Srx domain-containing protein n=1 Tax=Strongyloides stercoralis TaxID=6248 RepID=A0A0K0DXY3_STRER
MNTNITNRYAIVVTTSIKYLQSNIVDDVIITGIASIINILIIFITIIKEPFKSSNGVKSVVILYSISGLFYNVIKLVQYLFCYLMNAYKFKTVILISTFFTQFNLFLYNFYFLVPLIITYWRYMLIVHNRNVSFFENLIISVMAVIFNFITLIHTLFFSNDIYKNSAFSAYYSYGSLTDDVFAWFDMMPQIIGCTISLILNGLILLKIRNEKKQASSVKKNNSNEVSLTINLLIQTILPLFLVVYANVLYYFIFQLNIPSVLARKLYEILDLSYRILCPISLVLFMKIYRSYFKKIFCFEKITSTKISMTKNIYV